MLICLPAAGSRGQAADDGDGRDVSERLCFLSCQTSLFRPEEALTRGEAAHILCALPHRDGGEALGPEVAFTDVEADSPWYESVETVSALGVMRGYGDGSFRPEQGITRGEFAAALCRLLGWIERRPLPYEVETGQHWGASAMEALVKAGVLLGYEDGELHPDRPLTRAEAAVLVNRVLGRVPNRQVIDLVCRERPFEDVPREHWAYYDIIDAAWDSELLSCATGRRVETSGLLYLDGQLCHGNENGGLDCYAAGFHTVDGGLYYAAEDGFTLCRFPQGVTELDGSMFYVARDDGPFVTDYDLGVLHFGANGRYTSGDSRVDAYVDSILADILADSATTQEEKLRAAYLAIRDGGYSYMARSTGWRRGSTGWALKCARVMYETKRGACYYWAAAFLYLARRLGYQAYPVCGGVNQYDDLHAWVVIQWDDGQEYIFDVELEWGYRTGGGGRYPIREGRDLFKQPRNAPVLRYVFP